MKIKEIILFTSNIEKQKWFYQDVLDFKLVFSSKEKISFKAGQSILRDQTKSAHLAFNIPFGTIKESLVWLNKRVNILLDG